MNESNNDCVGAELASLCTQRRLCLCSTAVYATMFLNSLNLLPLTNHNASWDLSHPDRAETARQHLQPCFCFQSEAFFSSGCSLVGVRASPSLWVERVGAQQSEEVCERRRPWFVIILGAVR